MSGPCACAAKAAAALSKAPRTRTPLTVIDFLQVHCEGTPRKNTSQHVIRRRSQSRGLRGCALQPMYQQRHEIYQPPEGWDAEGDQHLDAVLPIDDSESTPVIAVPAWTGVRMKAK